MLSNAEKNAILRSFPKIELSYETLTHKKVFGSHVAMAIPEGKKYFLWLTKYQSKNVVLFMQLSEDRRQIVQITAEPFSLTDFVGFGTILYGTLFFQEGEPAFAIEDIFSRQQKNVVWKKNIQEKLIKMCQYLKTANKANVTYQGKLVHIGIPLIAPYFSQEMNREIQNLCYSVASIDFYFLNQPNQHFSMKYTYNRRQTDSPFFKETREPRESRDIVFRVKADIQNDIYHLYAFDSVKYEEYIYDTAYIPDYQTSVYMNGLFRNIKENANLDALEESDDEEEFENDKLDKYVDLQKSVDMICVYSSKFKKWVPTKVVPIGSSCKIITQKDLLGLEKNKR